MQNMIIYDLICSQKHRFEGWFKDSHDYYSQERSGLLECPLCASTDVRKIPAVSHISSGATQNQDQSQQARPLLSSLYQYLENTCENVGPCFAEEARKMHYGEKEQRGVYGTASYNEVRNLQEEGIEVLPLPKKPIDKNELN